MSEFILEAQKCKNCGSGLMVEVNDLITYCTNCGSGFDISSGEMNSIEINFANAAYREDGEIIYKPFWLLKSDVRILERTSSGGFFKNLFGGNDNSSGSINFYIPAFNLEVSKLKRIAKEFTEKNPVSSPQKYNAKLTGFRYGKEDAARIAEFVLISFEADKSDTMKTFRYDIKINSYEILGIPFYKKPDGSLKDAILGIEL